MSHVLSAFARPAPCCAPVTPTRTGDWRSTLGRLAEATREALLAAARRLQGHERLPEFDATTLRDLGLSHAPASWTPGERIADPWR